MPRASAAAGDEGRTVIAGYHWFTDWGRDTMISLEGLTLITGPRSTKRRMILRTFAHYMRDGLHSQPVSRRRAAKGCITRPTRRCGSSTRSIAISTTTDDRDTLARAAARALETSSSTTCAARASASASIPRTGLLRQGAEGYQLTWMDAKVGDWVVTPRRGKAVEINALWYNALLLLVEWLRTTGDGEGAERWAAVARAHARVVQSQLLERGAGCLYDVVDGEHGDDASCRPNQVLRDLAAASRCSTEPRWQRDARRRSSASCSRRSGCARCRRAHPTTSRATTATSMRATRPIIKARSGRG